MKYTLSTVQRHFNSGTHEHTTLLKLGFKFRTLSKLYGGPDGCDLEVVRAHSVWADFDPATMPTVELITMDDLRQLENLVGYALVVDDYHITIYNSYME